MSTKEDNRLPVRQGDVLLVPIAEPTMYAAPIRRDRKEGIVVAAGEATGHHHRIRSRHARMYRHNTNRFIRTFKCSVKEQRPQLTHEEHAPVDLAPGWWKVVMQREYTPRAPVRVYD